MDYNKRIPIVEVYTAIQGEGSRAGRPTIIIRTTGCTHRCWFGEKGGWCDSWYTSIHPEKGKYCFQDIVNLYDENPQISEMMLTGGSPTMHPDIVNECAKFCSERGVIMTMETEGSEFVDMNHNLHLLSLSPKFTNSIPRLGISTPQGKIVDEKFIDQHHKFRLNGHAIQKWLDFALDYHYKPVYDGTDRTLEEIEEFRVEFNIPKNKTYLMPAGDNRQSLLFTYPATMDVCMKMGYNFTGRPHIIAYDTQREV